MLHHCHAIDCAMPVAPKLLMCSRHWRILPAPAQRIVEHHYRAGQERDKRLSELYVLAASIAVLLVAHREGVWSARRALDRLAFASSVAQRRGLTVAQVEEMARAMGTVVLVSEYAAEGSVP
jgi:hypothetical protein